MAGERKRSRKGFRRSGKSRLGLWCALGVVVLLVAYVGVLEYSKPHVGGDRLRFDSFIGAVQKGAVKDARILNQDAVVTGRYARPDGSVGAYNAPYLKVAASQETLVNLLLKKRIPVTIDQQFSKSLVLPATIMIPSLIIVVIFIYLLLSYRRGTGLFGIKSGARKFESDERRVTFADVAGQEAAIAELRELVAFMSEPERFAELGARIPKGILLYGPPGCGKTLVARALAGEAGAAFYSISGSDFVELYVGVGAARVRELFKEARENAPAIVFVDELDSIGRRRRDAAVSAGSSGEQEQALNQILAEMDGFSALEGIILIGATNRPDVLDPALLRPGRFDRTVGLERPAEQDRLAILTLHASSRRIESGADLRAVASRAHGLTGADLANVINEAALLAAQARKPAISQVELDEGLKRILEAPERQRRLSMREQSVGRRATGEQERVTFADVAGVDDAIAEISEVRDFLAEPERFAAMGAKIPRGILLSGPPGCGKTLLAKAVAGEANAAFFAVAATEFVEVFVGQGAARVRDLFAEAKAVAPAILFIDEIDALGAHRAQFALDGHRERENTLNQLLVELDGFETRTGVIVMAATNRPDMLDAALLRPGRFDRQVEITSPDRAGRRAILAVHVAGKRLTADVDLNLVAGVTQGFSGADLANVVNEAALLATRQGLPEISRAVLEEAVERVLLGVGSRKHILSEDERKTVAYHEAGHALVGLTLPGVSVPHKISIVPRGRSLGHVWQIDEDERAIHARSTLINQMAMGLGGRSAEELVFGEPGSGAADDLARVSSMARKMVCEFGMSDALSGVSYNDQHYSDSRSGMPGYSEKETTLIGDEVRRLVHDAHERARRVVLDSRPTLDRIAAALLERETVSAQELETLIGRSKADGSRDGDRTQEAAGDGSGPLPGRALTGLGVRTRSEPRP